MKLKLNKIFMIEFLDHSNGGSLPPLCRVYGEIVFMTRKFIKVRTWKVLDEDFDESNDEHFNILISTIESCRELSPAPVTTSPKIG
jgi:hypothetical protein